MKTFFQTHYQWILLFCVCWLCFGKYWVYDIPGSIQTQITAWFSGYYEYTDASNLTLYAIYSYPNFIMAFLGGYVVDRLGVRVGTMIFCGLVTCGQVIFSFGIQWKIFELCLFGRFILGLGGESLIASLGAYSARYFRADQMGFAFGVIIGASRLGTTINYAVMPLFAEIGVPFSIWFGTGTCVFSFVMCIISGYLDKKAESMELIPQLRSAPKSFVEFLKSLKCVFQFPLSAWLLFIMCGFYYVTIIVFGAVASKILQDSGGFYTPSEASMFLVIPYVMGIILPPVLGKLSDHVGQSIWWVFLSCLLQLASFTCFLALAEGWYFIHPAISLVLFGLSYSIFVSATWPLLPFILPEKYIGSGFGMMACVENIGYSSVSEIIGYLQTREGISGTLWQNTIPIFIFMGCVVMVFISSFALLIDDTVKRNNILNAPGHIKQVHMEKLNQEFSEKGYEKIDDVDETSMLIRHEN